MQITTFDKQQEVLDCTQKYIAAVSGVQGGKTMSGVIWLIKEIIAHPYDDFLIAAPTYKILEQSTLKKFFDIFPMHTVQYKKQDAVLKLLPNAGNIYIRSTEIPNNIEGMTVRAAWLDEAGMMKPQIWTNILARVAAKKGRVLMTSTFYTLNWLWTEVCRRALAGDPDFAYFKWRSIDNPYFPKEEYERAKTILAPSEFERRYNGEPRKMQGIVYPDWNEEMIFMSPPDEFEEVVCGIDYGFTNPTAIEVAGIKTGSLYLVDELYQTRLTINEIVKEARELQGKWEITMFYCDPSAVSLIESMNQNNLPTYAANNDVDLGITRMQQLMEAKRFFVSFQNYNFIDEIESYHYKPIGMDVEKVPEYKKKPDKVFDHSLDAVRYIVATHPMEIFDIDLPVNKTRTNEFWDKIAKRMQKRTINIERYGEDYPDEDTELIDSLWI
jgi:phage terminase large subunit